MKISVICPVEEILSINKGGAIAAWVIEVYSRLGMELNYSIYCPGADDDGKGLRLGDLFYFNCIDSFVKVISFALAKITGKNKNSIRSKFFGYGRLWIKFLPKEVYKSDIIHLHNRPLYALWLRKFGYRGKIILHMHNDMTDYISSEQFTLVNKSVDDFWFCSDFLLRRCQSGFNLLSGSSIYNGVNFSGFSCSNKKDECFNDCSVRSLVIAGRIVKEKGVLEAIEICDKLNVNNSHRYTLAICGSTGSGGNNERTEYFDRVVNLAAKINKKHEFPIIEIKGHLNKEYLLNFISTCDLFIYPCQWDEPFGMVLIESMSVGTPLVASHKGGIPEIISPGVDGILISDSYNISDFVFAIERILSNSKEYDVIKINALRKIEMLFTWEHIAKRMLSLMKVTNSHLR